MLAGLVGCSQTAAEDAATEVEHLHGSSTGVAVQDTLFPGIGRVMNGCTGTLVAPDVVLTAAHCVTTFASKCGSERGLMSSPGNNGFSLNPDGSTNIAFTALADATIVHPLAAIDLSVCSGNNPLNCNMQGQPNIQTQIRVAHDLALVHLSGFNGLPDPTTYPRLQVLTDITTNLGGTAYSVHRALNQNLDFGPNQQAWACGEGSNDVNSSGIRFRGLFEFWQPSMGASTHWLQPGASYYSCNGTFVTNNDAVIFMNRTSTGGSSFNGAANDKGDSGSPLLIQGGLLSANNFPELPSGQYFIMGADSGDAAGFPQPTVGPVPNGSESIWYAPAFGSTNGSWLDQHITDFDGDGTSNFEDNCPTVPNDQRDSNWDAELELVLANFPTDTGKPPADFSDYNAVTHFWQTYRGDACDPDSSSQAVAGTLVASQTTTGPCDSFSCQGCNCTSTSTGTCNKVMTGGLSVASVIGNTYGDAKSVAGTTKPAFCLCTAGSTQLCKSLAQGDCVIANDNAAPFGNKAHGYFNITRGTGISDAYPFPAISTTHVDPTTGVVPATAQSSWDVLADFPALASGGGGAHQRADKFGVLWSHVTAFSQSSPGANTAWAMVGRKSTGWILTARSFSIEARREGTWASSRRTARRCFGPSSPGTRTLWPRLTLPWRFGLRRTRMIQINWRPRAKGLRRCLRRHSG